MAFATTNGTSFKISPRPICAINTNGGATFGFWWRRLKAKTTGATPLLFWDDGSSRLRIGELSGMLMADWIQPGYQPHSIVLTKSNLDVWQYFACRFISLTGGDMSVSLLASAPYIIATLTKQDLNVPLYPVSDICFGYDPLFGYGDIEICEISKFDHAISESEFSQLAAGADPLTLGDGPAWHVSCGKDLSRDRGGLRITSHSAIQTPQPAFLRR